MTKIHSRVLRDKDCEENLNLKELIIFSYITECSETNAHFADDRLRMIALIDTRRTDEVLQHFGWYGKNISFLAMEAYYDPVTDQIEDVCVTVHFSNYITDSKEVTLNKKELTLLHEFLKTNCFMEQQILPDRLHSAEYHSVDRCSAFVEDNSENDCER